VETASHPRPTGVQARRVGPACRPGMWARCAGPVCGPGGQSGRRMGRTVPGHIPGPAPRTIFSAPCVRAHIQSALCANARAALPRAVSAARRRRAATVAPETPAAAATAAEAALLGLGLVATPVLLRSGGAGAVGAVLPPLALRDEDLAPAADEPAVAGAGWCAAGAAGARR
jgi:hypothetical protein